MRQRHAFLLILIYEEAEPAVLRGRVRDIAGGTEAAFIGAEQLLALLSVPDGGLRHSTHSTLPDLEGADVPQP